MFKRQPFKSKPKLTVKNNKISTVVSHKELEQTIYQYLDWMQIEYTPTDASRTFGPDGSVRKSKVKKGWPDITCCLDGGKMFCIEVKTEKDDLRDEQVKVISNLLAKGALVVVARSVEDVAKAYRDYINSLQE